MLKTSPHEKDTCEDRIVSLEQPYVRPIQRGKRPNPTEFGQKLHLSVVDGYTFLEQTRWSNFNEGNDLEAAVEDYKRKFGSYPSAVLADRIYQTRSNKLFCFQRGIRLSGPPLGRRKISETDAKIKRQIYNDSCARNAIEGRNGNAKRRFGLDRIFAKLDETAKTEAALILLAMNASLRLVRWPVLFFRTLLLPLQFPGFSADPNLGLDSEFVIWYRSINQKVKRKEGVALPLQNTLRALSDPTRREILNLLKKESLPAGELAVHFPISAAAISKHLAILREAGLIRDRREGKFIFYELNASVLEEVLLWIKELRGEST